MTARGTSAGGSARNTGSDALGTPGLPPVGGTSSGTGDFGSGPSVKRQVRQAGQQVVGQAKDSVREARDKAAESLGQRKGRLAEQINTFAGAFRRTGDELRGGEHGAVAGVTDSIAEQAERFATYLRDRDAQAYRRDFEDLARRQPALVFGGAFALGLIASRFFKSSRRDQDREDSRQFARTDRQGLGYAGRAPIDSYGSQPYGPESAAQRAYGQSATGETAQGQTAVGGPTYGQSATSEPGTGSRPGGRRGGAGGSDATS